ncbi:MAG: NADH-quinone oxidoreductase subunit L, partial [Oceanicoccus sp.]
SSIGQTLKRFWFSHWALDWLYDHLFVKPYYGLSSMLSSEPVDSVYNLVVSLSRKLNDWLSQSQSGRMRGYIVSMVFGLIFVIALSLGVL